MTLSGEPLGKTTVRLSMASPAPSLLTNYAATTDAEGNFVFEEIEPADYFLSAERTGYLRVSYAAKGPNQPAPPLTLNAGEKKTGVVLKVTPQSLVAGKVTDEDGDPFPGPFVQLYRATFQNGQRQLQPIAGSRTLADGTFLIASLAAGKYYLSATQNWSRSTPAGRRELPGRKGSQDDYAITYFPSALDSARATPIELTAGFEARGIEIRMRKTRMYRIAGRVVPPKGSPSEGVVLSLNSALQPGGSVLGTHDTLIHDRDGRFEFHHLLPGSYVIATQSGSQVHPLDGGPPQPAIGRVMVTVTNEDLDNVVLTLGPGAEISGQFQWDGAAQPTGTRRPSLDLLPMQGFEDVRSLPQADAGGTFVLKNVAPNRYTLIPENLPDGWYVKHIRFEGRDLPDWQLDLTAGSGGKLEIIVSAGAAQITGVVRGEKGEVVRNPLLTLWQVGDPRPSPRGYFPIVKTHADGSFTIPNLAPGDCRVAAWEHLDFAAPLDPEFRERFDSKSVAIKLEENSTRHVDLTRISFETVEADVAKIR